MSKITEFKEYELIKAAQKRMAKLISLDPNNARYFNTNISVCLDNSLELHTRKVKYAKQVLDIADLITLREYVRYADEVYESQDKSTLNKIMAIKKRNFTGTINPLHVLDDIAKGALDVYEKALDTIEFDEDVHNFNTLVKSHKLRKNLTMPTYKKFTYDELEELECKNIKYYAKQELKMI